MFSNRKPLLRKGTIVSGERNRNRDIGSDPFLRRYRESLVKQGKRERCVAMLKQCRSKECEFKYRGAGNTKLAKCPVCGTERVRCTRYASLGSSYCHFHGGSVRGLRLTEEQDIATQLLRFVRDKVIAIDQLGPEAKHMKVDRALFKEIALANVIDLVNRTLKDPDKKDWEKLRAIETAINAEERTAAKSPNVSINFVYELSLHVLTIVQEELLKEKLDLVFERIYERIQDEIRLPERYTAPDSRLLKNAIDI